MSTQAWQRGRRPARRAAPESRDPTRVLSSPQEPKERPVVFMFPGQGAQYPRMGLELYQTEPVFRAAVDHCAELLLPHLGLDLRAVLYPDERPTPRRGSGQATNDGEPRTKNQEPRDSGNQESGVRSQESGVRSQESETSAPAPQSPIPNPQSPIPNLRSSVLSPQSPV